MSWTASDKSPSFWQLQALGWGGFTVLVVGVVMTHPDHARTVAGNTGAIASMILGSIALRPLCRALVRRPMSWYARAAWALAGASVGGVIAAVATELLFAGPDGMSRGELARDAVQFTFVLFLWCNLYFSIKERQRLAREREQLLRAESEAKTARLSALRYQLDPHFLFNALNAVSTLVLAGNTTGATRMLAQLGELLRTTFDNDVALEIPLSSEVALARQYLAIEQTRLGARLTVDMDIAPDTVDALVPTLLLQPLIENAVRHGVAPQIAGGTIAVRTARHEQQLHIQITNSGRAGAVRSRGVGLTNTAERLATLYGADHRFALGWPEAGGCDVTLELPYRTACAR
jgi:two-component system, LytTR family, sensor kinase